MAAVFTCPPGSICSPQAKTPVGPNKTGIFHASATKVTTQGSNGEVTGAETVVYIIKNNTFQPAAISKDGGKTYAFSDPNYPLMTGVAGADLQNDLKNPQGAIRKIVDAGVAQSVDRAGLKPADKKTIVASTTNNAPDPGTGDGAVARQSAEADAKTENKSTRNNFPTNLVYPENLASAQQDVIKFNMVKYRPRKLSTGGDLNPVQDRVSGDIIGTVVLPIPNGISDTNMVNWGGDELNPLKALGVDIAMAGMTGGVGAAADRVAAGAGEVQNNTKTVQQLITSALTEAATGTQNLLSRTQGQVINPNMELLFLGPQLRPFNFTFKLASRSEAESKIIRSIIRFFKQGSSPIRTEANLFLKAPHTFQMQYLHKGQPHTYLNKFKECALQSFNVSYTPEGQYATFTDGAMVSYQITMQFQELEPIFNDDYTNDGTNPSPDIGY